MSRRSSSGSARGRMDTSSGGGGGGGRGGGASMASALQTASLEMDRLRAELLSSLTSVVTDTVDMAFEQHEENFVQAAQAVHQLSGGGGGGGAAYGGRTKPSSSSASRGAHANGEAKFNGDMDSGAMQNDFDLFQRCCQRLVNYINTNMTTSTDFKQQMDRVILACHSNASETVLESVVTKKLWFHPKSGSEDDEEQEDEEEVMDDDEDNDEVVELRVKPSRGRVAAPRAAPAKPAPVRGPKRRASVLPPPPPPPAARSARAKSPVKKRARRESASRKINYAPSDEGSEEEEVEEEPRKRKGRAARIHYSEDEDDAEQNEDEDDDVVYVKNDGGQQPHYGQADELLNFKDAIGDMCYADRRTPAQTRFFKDRLRKAIQFVDSQLCKPPKGKSCDWGCVKIRRQMCNRDLPCRNKICRLWHDVEAHTDRCQNAHCEFRIRVMLRETMYKIDHKKMELQGFRNELHSKKKDLLELKYASLPDRENFVERRLLENEIDQLESEIENAEKDLGVFKATQKTYWATLNEIGITVEDDVNDQFPVFKMHYVDKKAPKKKTPTKARKSDEHTPSPVPAASSRPERGRRRQSSDAADTTASPVQKRERITRRSTQQSLKVLTNGVIELDDDDDEEMNEEEEAKTDRSAEYDEDTSTRAAHGGSNTAETNDAEVPVPDRVRSHKSHDEGVDMDEDPQHEDGNGGNDMTVETEEQDVDRAAPTTNSADALGDSQSADYVIESEDATSEDKPAETTSESTTSSALEAFNSVVDARSTPSQPTDQIAPALSEDAAGEKESQTTATVDEDNVPLLPF